MVTSKHACKTFTLKASSFLGSSSSSLSKSSSTSASTAAFGFFFGFGLGREQNHEGDVTRGDGRGDCSINKMMARMSNREGGFVGGRSIRKQMSKVFSNLRNTRQQQQQQQQQQQ